MKLRRRRIGDGDSAWSESKRTVKLVVGVAPGWGSDTLARLLADQISQAQGVTMIVENRPGAGTVIATEAVSRAIPKTALDVSWYDEFLRRDLEDDLRKKIQAEREVARAYEKEREAWQPHYERAIEYPASRIFVALRGGVLQAKGRLLPDGFGLRWPRTRSQVGYYASLEVSI